MHTQFAWVIIPIAGNPSSDLLVRFTKDGDGDLRTGTRQSSPGITTSHHAAKLFVPCKAWSLCGVGWTAVMHNLADLPTTDGARCTFGPPSTAPTNAGDAVLGSMISSHFPKFTNYHRDGRHRHISRRVLQSTPSHRRARSPPATPKCDIAGAREALRCVIRVQGFRRYLASVVPT
ncbi:hypothetical protein JX265_009416 [Neoarthrinium moseri]|uniref:Uncharacterized protein n=1 Tax=Neoarthrinium moseri TaxID=1658444 RepID=A0A9P9WGE6_9PEZI|nr:hypothetical protein JX266_011984 [Neoarthrinium moseri]KAI1861913.1 hypothetical protein JX265_009416 [Neoarthrinium moseri]